MNDRITCLAGLHLLDCAIALMRGSYKVRILCESWNDNSMMGISDSMKYSAGAYQMKANTVFHSADEVVRKDFLKRWNEKMRTFEELDK